MFSAKFVLYFSHVYKISQNSSNFGALKREAFGASQSKIVIALEQGALENFVFGASKLKILTVFWASKSEISNARKTLFFVSSDFVTVGNYISSAPNIECLRAVKIFTFHALSKIKDF